MKRRPRQHDEKYLKFVRTLNCVICGTNISIEAAHVRMADRSVGKRSTGMGEKPDDKWTLPLCTTHHRRQHEGNEAQFWSDCEKDPVKLALAIWDARDDYSRASEIVDEQT